MPRVHISTRANRLEQKRRGIKRFLIVVVNNRKRVLITTLTFLKSPHTLLVRVQTLAIHLE